MSCRQDIVICERCGSQAEAIHHKNHNHDDNSAKNRQKLCDFCHGKEHGTDGGYETQRNAPYDTTFEISDIRLGQRLKDGYEMIYGE